MSVITDQFFSHTNFSDRSGVVSVECQLIGGERVSFPAHDCQKWMLLFAIGVVIRFSEERARVKYE